MSVWAGAAFADGIAFQKIASGVYVAIAPNESASPANRGFVSNLGFVVGQSGVIAIGTGASERQGETILAAIRKLTRKPVVLAINLQATPDHVLGNRSFVRRKGSDPGSPGNRPLHGLQLPDLHWQCAQGRR
ncbi:MAG: hypothetical protein IPL80_03325 [Sterolibacteriaceae bacterium]|nr:hypothetical protein [Sterolibacteriaceae bacterium]